jgi:hypothetical protein
MKSSTTLRSVKNKELEKKIYGYNEDLEHLAIIKIRKLKKQWPRLQC